MLFRTIVIMIGGLYILPVHEVTVNMTFNGEIINGAAITIDGEYKNSQLDGNAIYNLAPGTYDVMVRVYKEYKNDTITVGMFDMKQTISFEF